MTKLKGELYIVVGPSGTGKSTLVKYAEEELGAVECVSHTTRKPREGEVHGVNYYFIQEEEFEGIDKVEESKYGDAYYCLSKKEVEDKMGRHDKLFIVADMHGANQIKELYPSAKIIYVTIPLEEMERRMRSRKDPEEKIQARLKHAIETKEHENGKYADFIIENYDLEESKRKIREILQAS